MARGSLRVYLGAAPGVGKTFAMLGEGRRRASRGTDVVVGVVDTHGRARTAEQLADLEVVPRRQVAYRGTTLTELDVDGVLARRPEVVLVDELSHTNVPGSRNEKRWQDVEELLEAGIDVISTVNVQHLESLNDVVERIAGVEQRETVPDAVVRRADQIELVDMSPEALRRRMAHGNIYPAERVDAALANYFRVGNLGALRELALLWVADQVDDALDGYRRRHGITDPWETRERVVVAVTGAPGTEQLVRRAARMAQRSHGELIGVHVRTEEGVVGPATDGVEEHRRLVTELGGEFHETSGRDPAAALVAFATAENATQLVLGASRRSRWAELLRGSVINRVVRASGPIDVHVISVRGPVHPPSARRPGQRWSPAALPLRRRTAGWILALVGDTALTLGLLPLRQEHVGLPTVLLLYLLLAVTTAAVGGVQPALVAAVVGFLLANFFFTPPFHTLTIDEGENLVSLFVFLLVAGIVSWLVDTAARLAAEAAHARSQAETLARLAATVEQDDPVRHLLDHLRSAFALDGAALLRTSGGSWTVEASSGDAADQPDDAEVTEWLAPDLVLALVGPPLAAEDRRVVKAFTAQLAAVLERRRLRSAAAEATGRLQADQLRTALLQAISHDLRTPLAGIKTSVTSLAQDDVTWSPEDEREFLRTIDEETDRLTRLIDNLLDMSRIQAGALDATSRPVAVDEVTYAALASLGPKGRGVRVDVPETLPLVDADPALLERVLANLIGNAVAWSPVGAPPGVDAGLVEGRIVVRVVDHGRGVAPAARDDVFQPFQRLGDGTPGGVGLGLAVARGLARAQGGEVELDDTPGGGTTALVTLRVAT